MSATSTVDSKPYMCCAGTVPTIAVPVSSRSPIDSASRSASACALATSSAHGFGCGTGAPVDPDVSTRATMRSASICGGVAVTSSGACSAR